MSAVKKLTATENVSIKSVAAPLMQRPDFQLHAQASSRIACLAPAVKPLYRPKGKRY